MRARKNEKYVKLAEVTGTLTGWLVDRELAEFSTVYVIKTEENFFVRLIGGKDLATKMDPADNGDFVAIKFLGWKKLSCGNSYMLSEVGIEKKDTYI